MFNHGDPGRDDVIASTKGLLLCPQHQTYDVTL